MGKVYGGVQGINKPEFGSDFKTYEKACDAYCEAIVDYAKHNGSGTAKGKEIRFQVADGYARYVVLSLKPVQLIHLDVMDGYTFQYANRLTATDVQREIDYYSAEHLQVHTPQVTAKEKDTGKESKLMETIESYDTALNEVGDVVDFLDAKAFL